MIKFTTPCDLRVLPNGDVQLLAPLVFNGRDYQVKLHTGFTWNLASIPRGMHDLVGDPFDYVMESALHDGLYASGLLDRPTSDLYWYLALRSGGEFKTPVSKPLAKALYAGVRVGGSTHYKSGSLHEARKFVEIICYNTVT